MIMSLPVSVYAETRNSEELSQTTQVTEEQNPEEPTNPGETTNPEEPENPTKAIYNITFKYVDGHTVTQTVEEGEIPTPPEGTAAKHDETNHSTYAWPEMEKATLDTTYEEVETKEEHKYGAEVTPPTCTEQGYTTYTCECGYSYSDYVDATNHTWDEGKITTQAICTEEGVKTFTCTACGEIKTEIVPATGHRFIKTSYNSTAENDAYEYICEVCNLKLTYITHHNWDDGTTVKEATCTEVGVRIYTCTGTDCHETKAEMIPKIEHTYVAEVTPPTCTEQGYTTYTCACGDSYSDYVDKTGHKWSAESANCTNCTAEDELESFTVSCDKTQYYVGDKWSSKLTLIVKFENHEATITTDDNFLVEKFSTAKVGEKLYSVKYGDITLKDAVKITVIAKPKLTVKTTSGETVYNDYSYVLGDKGISFTAKSNTGDKICYAKGRNLSVSLSKGVYTVKPTKYFTINAKNYKNYYVTFYFERYGNKYATKLYFSCGIVGLKCVTAASTFTQGSGVTKSLKFRQTYIDGTTGQFSVKKALSTKSVGKKTVSYSYYGEKAVYAYYVKCKAPTLKAKGKSKAVSLSWKKIPGATGYKIYRATSKNGKYTAIKTIKKGSTTNYKNTGLKSRKTYYYKIKAIYSKNAKCNSSFSAVRSCRTK